MQLIGKPGPDGPVASEDWIKLRRSNDPDVPLTYYTLGGLEPQTWYQLEVVAFNSIGWSLPNDQFSFHTRDGKGLSVICSLHSTSVDYRHVNDELCRALTYYILPGGREHQLLLVSPLKLLGLWNRSLDLRPRSLCVNAIYGCGLDRRRTNIKQTDE